MQADAQNLGSKLPGSYHSTGGQAPFSGDSDISRLTNAVGMDISLGDPLLPIIPGHPLSAMNFMVSGMLDVPGLDADGVSPVTVFAVPRHAGGDVTLEVKRSTTLDLQAGMVTVVGDLGGPVDEHFYVDDGKMRRIRQPALRQP
jgi:hypothetical protein